MVVIGAQMSVLDLKSVSPKLLKAQDLSLCIPGTYRVDGSCVKIHKFLTHLQVSFSYLDQSVSCSRRMHVRQGVVIHLL